MTDDTDQTERLKNRIEEQQDRIDDLEETVQKMMPSRRQLLAGAGIAGASALTGGALTGGASAAPQGQIGTSSAPVDTVYASTLDVGTAKYDQVDVDTNLAVNSLDTDDATISNRTALAAASSSTDLNISFDNWTTVDSDNACLFYFRTSAETDGTNAGQISIRVDESGGTTDDYSNDITFADPGLGNGGRDFDGNLIYLPAGSQIIIENSNDPNQNNQIIDTRKFVLGT